MKTSPAKNMVCNICGKTKARSQMMPAAIVRSAVVEQIRPWAKNGRWGGIIRGQLEGHYYIRFNFGDMGCAEFISAAKETL